MKVYRRNLRISRATACFFSFLLFGALQFRRSQKQAATSMANSQTNMQRRWDSNFALSHDFRGTGRPVSLVFDKRAKTGSTSVNAALRKIFPGKKFIECGMHSPATALKKMFRQTEKVGFDVFDCHISTTWTDRAAIERQAKAHVAWMTITRDPFERLMSHVKHALRGSKKKGDVTRCFNINGEQVSSFYRTVHREYLLTEFEDLQTLHDEVSTGKICSRWDIILESETLEDDVSKYLGFTNLSKENVAPSSCGNVTHEEALVIKAELHEEYLHHRALLACKKSNKQLRLINGNITLT